MPEHGDLLQQLFQQHGLLGLLLGFLILGPGYTYFRTRNIHAQAEAKAQDILNEFAVRERQRADRLEARLNTALTKLDQAEEEVERLRHQIAENRLQLLALPPLHQQVDSLTRQVGELERLVESQNRELTQKTRQIQDLQQTLLDPRTAQPETTPNTDE